MEESLFSMLVQALNGGDYSLVVACLLVWLVVQGYRDGRKVGKALFDLTISAVRVADKAAVAAQGFSTNGIRVHIEAPVPVQHIPSSAEAAYAPALQEH